MICYMTTSSSQTLKMGICKTKGQMVAWLAVAGLTLEFTDARGGMDGCDRRYDYLEFTDAKGENMRNKRPDGAMACCDRYDDLEFTDPKVRVGK